MRKKYQEIQIFYQKNHILLKTENNLIQVRTNKKEKKNF